MDDQQLHAFARAFVRTQHPWVDRKESLVAVTVANLTTGWLVRVSLAAGMLQMSVVVQPDGHVRLPSVNESACIIPYWTPMSM